MGRSVSRAILEGIRKKQEDSEMQMYATEPPGAMGEGGDFNPAVNLQPSTVDEIKRASGQGMGAQEIYKVLTPEAREDLTSNVMGEPDRSTGGRNNVLSTIELYAKSAPNTGVGTPPANELELTIDESGTLDENEWMTLDEMELDCVECADKMRERKMTRILRREAEECKNKYGKKECGPAPDDEG